MTALYVPPTGESDHQKQNMSLQLIGGKTFENIVNIATNTADIATNTAGIATNTTGIATNTAAIATINAATYVNSFKTRTGTVVPLQGDYTSDLIPGTTTNSSATAGNIGEYIESVIAPGSPVSLATGTSKNITSISLTAGDWDVSTSAYFLPTSSTSITFYGSSISGTTGTFDPTPGRLAQTFIPATVNGGFAHSSMIPPYRLSLASTTTMFLVANSNFTVSTCSAYGIIRARRVR